MTLDFKPGTKSGPTQASRSSWFCLGFVNTLRPLPTGTTPLGGCNSTASLKLRAYDECYLLPLEGSRLDCDFLSFTSYFHFPISIPSCLHLKYTNVFVIYTSLEISSFLSFADCYFLNLLKSFLPRRSFNSLTISPQ